MKTMKVRVDVLTDATMQTRVGLDETTVAEYAEAMTEGKAFPPVVVYHVAANAPSYLLVDGFHRVAAARAAGYDEIDANVFEGSTVDALNAALGANLTHGRRRTNADKRRALEIAWAHRVELFPACEVGNIVREAGNPTSRQLAEKCGVSHNFASDFMNLWGEVSSDDTSPLDDEDDGLDDDPTPDDGGSRFLGTKALLKAGKDRFGTQIPERILPAFQTAELRRLTRLVREIRASVADRTSCGEAAFAAVPQQALINLDNAARELKFAAAYCVCRGCGGEGCYRCGKRGFQTLSQYKMMPADWKQGPRARA